MPVHIVGDSRLLRDMFLAICTTNDFDVGTCCSQLASLPDLVPGDLVLLHSRQADAVLQARLRAFRGRAPETPLILVVGEEPAPEAQVALGAYADAVIPEQKSGDALMAALHVVRDGYRIVMLRPTGPADEGVQVLPPSPAPARPRTDQLDHGLSDRESLILRKLIEGGTNKSIANDLGICEATVKVHLRTCFRKIGAKNRTQAALWASEQLGA